MFRMNDFDLQTYAQTIAAAERFPLGSLLVVILVATMCIAALLVLAWFLFKTRLPRSYDQRRKSGGSDRGD